MGRKAAENGATSESGPDRVCAMGRDEIDAILRHQVGIMAAALQRIDPPEDHAGVERMAKAVILVKKAHDMICPVDAPGKNNRDSELRDLDAMYDDEQLPPFDGPDALDAWVALLERKVARYRRPEDVAEMGASAHTSGNLRDVSGPEGLDEAGTDTT